MTRVLCVFGMIVAMAASAAARDPQWLGMVKGRLPLYGHRNWIVIADSAYPEQANEGIDTVVSGASQEEVVKAVLDAVAATKHVRAIVLTDKELAFVPEADAPGVEAYRTRLAALLKGRNVQTLPHEEIIAKLDKAGETFKVLIIKTTMTIPYTSVFLQLDCGYWSADAEKRLRTAMNGR